MDGTQKLPESGPLPGKRLSWSVVGADDFDGDGYTDILWRNLTNGKNVVWFMDGAVPRPESGLLPPKTNMKWAVVGTADFDSDGYTDILWRNLFTGNNVIWFLEGTTLDRVSRRIEAVDTSWTVVGTGE